MARILRLPPRMPCLASAAAGLRDDQPLNGVRRRRSDFSFRQIEGRFPKRILNL